MTDEKRKELLQKHADDIDYLCDNAEPHKIREVVEQAFLAGWDIGVITTLADGFQKSLESPEPTS